MSTIAQEVDSIKEMNKQDKTEISMLTENLKKADKSNRDLSEMISTKNKELKMLIHKYEEYRIKKSEESSKIREEMAIQKNEIKALVQENQRVKSQAAENLKSFSEMFK